MLGWLLTALFGCQGARPDPPDPYAVDPKVCEPEIASWAGTPTLSTVYRLGHSVELISFGVSSDDLNRYKAAVFGGPGRVDDQDVGVVELVEAGDDGRLDGSSALNTALTAPSRQTGVGSIDSSKRPGPSGYQFGFDVLAADVVACRQVMFGTYHEKGCGQELLVSSPDTFTHSEGGFVYLFESTNHPSADGALVHATTLADPSGSGSGEFGYSMASSPSTWFPDPDAPWDVAVAGEHPGFLVVGAPGDERVELFEVQPGRKDPLGAPAPFVLKQTIHSPSRLSRGFGESVLLDDFNGDLIADLAVAAPTGGAGGRVYVYRGKNTDEGWTLLETPLKLSLKEIPGLPTADGFGAALASGRLIGDRLSNALLVGAPRYGPTTPEEGAICQFLLASDASTDVTGPGLVSEATDTRCAENPDNLAYENFGASVAVGNFGAVNTDGGLYTDPATPHDLAVGRPGWDDGDGRATIFYTGGDGLDLSCDTSQIYEMTGYGSGARFGASLTPGYVQSTWWTDLAVGAPEFFYGFGQGSLSRATSPSDTTCPVLEGVWDVSHTSRAGVPVSHEIVVWVDASGYATVTFNEGLRLNVVHENTQELCTKTRDGVEYDTSFWIPVGTTVSLGESCERASTATGWEWPEVAFGPLIVDSMDRELWELLSDARQNRLLSTTARLTVMDRGDGRAELEVELDWGTFWTDKKCNTLRDKPFLLTQVRDSVCEDW